MTGPRDTTLVKVRTAHLVPAAVPGAREPVGLRSGGRRGDLSGSGRTQCHGETTGPALPSGGTPDPKEFAEGVGGREGGQPGGREARWAARWGFD